MQSQQRRPPPSAQDYYAVPQSPQAPNMQNSHPSYNTSETSWKDILTQGAIAQGVASGVIGAGYGPYSYNPTSVREGAFNNGSRFSCCPLRGIIGNMEARKCPADPDLDDALHNPDPAHDAALDNSFTLCSARGWANVGTLFVLVVGLITLFAGYPIIHYFTTNRINVTGQVPSLPGLPSLIDADTPSDGNTYQLVFSDEFNTDGRTFWPGDDPFWEAENLHYCAGDLEWYYPSAVTTQNGKLTITMTEQPMNNLNFVSGMVTSWNKFCFTTGYIEVSMSMPGSPLAPGLWPGAWTMGNLGRAGYGGTTEGTWPYSYTACDCRNASEPNSKLVLLQQLPVNVLSSCTCPGGDHPGPSVSVGRGVPEIDILETQVDVSVFKGQVSQSFQTAPYNYMYQFNNASPATTINDTAITQLNTYVGGLYQQALSAVTYIDSNNYAGQGYATYGFEWWSNPSNRPSGYITWYSESAQTWKITPNSIEADSTVQISDRLIPEEPMYIVFNLGMAPSFQEQDFMHLQFPTTMYVDYVRVYQREGLQNAIGCDPPGHPTASYINAHLNAYTNPNVTTWAQGGYQFPSNSLVDTC
ncbi:glycoside hydrolase family 16 protein [Pisolithus croceorrhizus]|nr:glycoside hydrolase family 16 protein [Pisolithus croceorrhizus]